MRPSLFFFAIPLFGLSSTANAVTVSLSGGNGSPLTVTFPDDLLFTNVTPGMSSYGVVIQGAASGASNSTNTHSGTARWQSAGGPSSASGIMGVENQGDSTADDVVVFWGFGGDQVPSTASMTLLAGTRTTSGNINSIVTQGSGDYTVRMINNFPSFASDPATVVPEPGTAAFVALGSALSLLARRRR